MANSSEVSETAKTKRPTESAFKQQRLPAWQPILTAGTVLPTFFVIGIAFIPVGIGLLYFSEEVKEHIIDYTTCMKYDDTNVTCADYIKQTNMNQECICEMELNLTEDFKGDVYFYYGLSNYYQNHRRYVKSRDDRQLLGQLSLTPSSDCEPFAYNTEGGVKTPVAPCGAIANSLFNDTLSVYSKDLGTNVPVLRTGIAWTSDKDIKFRNPSGDLETAFANFTKPVNWKKQIWQLDLEDPENNGFQNEDLIVWMRTAALPTFRKLYRRVDHTQTGFSDGLVKGPYTLRVVYNYPVIDFQGTKTFIISTTSLLGGKNPFLGVAYIVVGTLCLLLGIILLVIHVRCSKRYYPFNAHSFIDLDFIPKKDRPVDNPTFLMNQPATSSRKFDYLEPIEYKSEQTERKLSNLSMDEKVPKPSGNVQKSKENVGKSSNNDSKSSDNVSKSENDTKSSDNVPKPSENYTSSSDNLPKPSENVPKSSDNDPKSSKNVPKSKNETKSSDNVPKSSENYTSSSDNLPKPSENVLKSSDNDPKSSKNVPKSKNETKSSDNVPKPSENVPKSSDNVPKPSEDVPESLENVPEPTADAPTSFKKAPENDPKPKDPIV